MRRVTLFIIAVAALTSCRHLPDFSNDPVVAKVGEKVLRQSELAGIVPAGITGEDSIVAIQTYVEGWAMRYIKLAEAERLLKGDEEFERQMREYREALLIRRLDLLYAGSAKDAMFSDGDVTDYYASHKAEFTLDRTIVRGIIVRVPLSYRQQAHLKELLMSPLESRRQDFRDIVVKNGFEMHDFNTWTNWLDFAAMLPEEAGGNANMVAIAGKYSEFTVGEEKYMVLVESALRAGDTAPLEWVAETIRRILNNQRTNDAIRHKEDSLYNVGIAEGKITVNV